jgi:hypothetical protein
MGLSKKHSRRRALPLRRGLCNRGDIAAFQMFGYSTIVHVVTDWSINTRLSLSLSLSLSLFLSLSLLQSAVKDGGSQAHLLTVLLLSAVKPKHPGINAGKVSAAVYLLYKVTINATFRMYALNAWLPGHLAATFCNRSLELGFEVRGARCEVSS